MSFEAEFVNTQTADGVELIGLHAENSQSKEVILHLHGMQGNFFQNSFVHEMLEKYPQNDISFVSGELRGAEAVRYYEKGEEFVPIGNAYEKFEESLKDIDAWVNYLINRGYEEIHLQGHSLGCSKIVYYLNQSERDIESAILITPSDMAGFEVEDPETGEDLVEKARKVKQKGEGNQIITQNMWGWAYLSVDTVLNFFDEGSNLEIFNFSRPELGFDQLEDVEIPVLAFFGTDNDGIVTPPEECASILETEIGSEKVIAEVLEGAEHSYEGYEDVLVNEIIEFLS